MREKGEKGKGRKWEIGRMDWEWGGLGLAGLGGGEGKYTGTPFDDLRGQ